MAKKKKRALVVGGSSGLGAEIAKLLRKQYAVTVTGTTEPEKRGKKKKPPGKCRYVQLDVGHCLWDCLPALRKIAKTDWDLLVWAAGCEREAVLEEHTLEDLELITNVGFLAPATLVGALLLLHQHLGQLVLISGMTSDDTAEEPIMAPVRQALEAFARSMWRDERVESVLVAAPDRMKGTWYYTGTGRDTSSFARVEKVAERIFAFMKDRTKFRELHFSGEVASVHRQDYSNGLLGEIFP